LLGVIFDTIFSNRSYRATALNTTTLGGVKMEKQVWIVIRDGKIVAVCGRIVKNRGKK